MDLEATNKLSEEQKAEIIQRAQHVVNNIQIKQLADIVDMIKAVLDDPQKRYYIVIDRLDEDWVEDRVRYLLIRALIETARTFSTVRNAKIVIALRADLLERVYSLTRDPGFQEEKYESMYLPITWDREQLIQVLDKRINYLIERTYTNQTVSYKDVLPPTIGKKATIDYMLERTLMRPRDIIHFFNCCIEQAAGSPNISAKMITAAEAEYSRARLRSLADEWSADFPCLPALASLLHGRPPVFSVGEITEAQCEDFCLDMAAGCAYPADKLFAAAVRVAEARLAAAEFRKLLVHIFYKVGLLGLKLHSQETVAWSINRRQCVSICEIRPDTRISIHPFAWRALGVSSGEARRP
jgi:hypothetical protein